jgi:hypothetical protein
MIYMERVLIVAKTRMSSQACIGGLTLNTNRSVRLLTSNGSNQSQFTPFDIGQIWDLRFRQSPHIRAPHVEDVLVTKQRFVARQLNLREALMRRVKPWQGGPQDLFDGLLSFSGMRAYISETKALPNCSTGFWLPSRSLELYQEGRKAYYQIDYQLAGQIHTNVLRIPYVGFAEELIQEIPANTLVRVSLARWFQPSSVSEERCYLQFSGWYL